MEQHIHPLPNGKQTGLSVQTQETGLHFHPLPDDAGSTAVAGDNIGHKHKISGTNDNTGASIAPNPS